MGLLRIYFHMETSREKPSECRRCTSESREKIAIDIEKAAFLCEMLEGLSKRQATLRQFASTSGDISDHDKNLETAIKSHKGYVRHSLIELKKRSHMTPVCGACLKSNSWSL